MSGWPTDIPAMHVHTVYAHMYHIISCNEYYKDFEKQLAQKM